MKNKIQSSFALLSAVAIFTAAFLTSAGFPVNEPQPELAIGAKAPLADAAMANVDGTMMTLESAAGPNGLLVVFSCNTCPFVVGNGSKINHLSYVGDAELGEMVNIGAGTITCNYDGVNKHKTEIGDNSFVGSNSTLVAPVVIEQDGFVAAGSTINSTVAAGNLAVGRAKQRNIAGWKRPTKNK